MNKKKKRKEKKSKAKEKGIHMKEGYHDIQSLRWKQPRAGWSQTHGFADLKRREKEAIMSKVKQICIRRGITNEKAA